MAILSTIAAILLPVAAVFAATPALKEGRWNASDKGEEGLHIFLQWGSTSLGQTFARSELHGLSTRETTTPTTTPVSFRIEREAGTFTLQGTFKDGNGSGQFTFQPNSRFAQTLASLGIRGADRVTDDDLMLLTIGSASTPVVREFTGAGLGSLSVREVVDLFIHGITPEYVRSVQSLRMEGTNSVAGVVELRIHRITREYVRELEALGYRNLAREQLLQMGIHGVDRAQVQGLERVGYRNLTPDQLVAMRIQSVTPEFIQEMREVGFRGLSPEALVDLRIHRVSAQYVRELEALGYRNLPRQQLLQMGLHGVTPAFIRQAREAGARDLSPDALVRMKIFGIGSETARGAGRGR